MEIKSVVSCFFHPKRYKQSQSVGGSVMRTLSYYSECLYHPQPLCSMCIHPHTTRSSSRCVVRQWRTGVMQPIRKLYMSHVGLYVSRGTLYLTWDFICLTWDSMSHVGLYTSHGTLYVSRETLYLTSHVGLYKLCLTWDSICLMRDSIFVWDSREQVVPRSDMACLSTTKSRCSSKRTV